MADSQEATILPFAPLGNSGEDVKIATEDLREQLRMVEAILFASADPVSEKNLEDRLPDGANLKALMAELQQAYFEYISDR